MTTLFDQWMGVPEGHTFDEIMTRDLPDKPVRPKHIIPDEVKQEIVRRVNAGHKHKDIERDLHLGRGYVGKFLFRRSGQIG